MSRRRLVVALALLGAGCGVPRDDEPRAIPSESIPIETQADAGAEPASGGIVGIWLVNGDDLLEREDRRVARADDEGRLSLRDVLQSLLGLPLQEELDEGLRSVIPASILLLGVTDPVDGEVVVDLTGLTGASLGAGEAERLAVGQIVCTAQTAGYGVDAVRFRVNGDDVSAPDETGALSTEPLGCDDFEDLRAPTGPGPAG